MNYLSISEKSCRVLCAVTLFCFLTTGCRSMQTSIPVPVQSPASVTPLSVSLNLWQSAMAENKSKTNIWLSPISVSMAMQSVYDGAVGQTKDELSNIVCDYHPESNDQLKIADALFVDPKLSLIADYEQRMRDKGAEIYQQVITGKDINQWASNHTNGKVNDIMPDPLKTPLDVVIANAIYFDADWIEPFRVSATREDTFYVTPKHPIQVPMMRQTKSLSYMENDEMQAVTLYYSRKSNQQNNVRYAMTIILPKPQVNIEKLMAGMTTEKLDQWLDESYYFRRLVSLHLPKTTIQYNRILNQDLKNMGIRCAFSPSQADFSAMCRKQLFIDMVKQSSYLRMDEKGTEAAAVTVVGMKTTSARPSEDPVEMYVERPYLLVLRDMTNDVPLFVGTVYNPVQ